MDTIADDSRSLYRRLGAEDRDRLDQYTTSVREVERLGEGLNSEEKVASNVNEPNQGQSLP